LNYFSSGRIFRPAGDCSGPGGMVRVVSMSGSVDPRALFAL